MNSNRMKFVRSLPRLGYLLTPVLVFGALAACTNLERSRDTSNPNVSGRTLAQQVCSNCHGVTGSSISPNFPNLAGQQVSYIEAQLTGFRSHRRRDPAGFQYMWGLSRDLTDKQINELAEYYAQQTPIPHAAEALPEQVQAGQRLFTQGLPDRQVIACVACHGEHAQGNGAMPRLAGQHADYVIKQLKVFQRGDERPEGAVMTTIAHGLSESDIDNVAAYVESLQN
ncbi:MAG TPA: c-type cytochrome [Aquabacterium sp.]|nr:c-type cytochrome [Aquabacterium sp.]